MNGTITILIEYAITLSCGKLSSPLYHTYIMDTDLIEEDKTQTVKKIRLKFSLEFPNTEILAIYLRIFKRI
jgi:hypothetical protein